MTILTKTVQQHINYNYWAHRRIWEYILMLTDEQFNKLLDYSQGSICNQIVHTLWAEEIWLSRIIGELAPTAYAPDDFENRTAIRAKWDALEEKMRQNILQMDDSHLTQIVHYQNSKGIKFEQSVLQIILHMVNHGTDHRAQTLAMMHVLGASTVDQDLILYYREL